MSINIARDAQKANDIMKSIILAGGKGTRLYPATETACKQLLPIYDKPMIYYPLATMMLAGIRDILIISNPGDLPVFRQILGDGSKFGIKLSYARQSEPRGIAEAFVIGEEFIGGDSVCLILGDNLFYGSLDFLRRGIAQNRGGTIFAYEINNPARYGVVEFDSNMNILSIEEKPENPKSNFAVPGLYLFTSDVIEEAKKLKPSKRGELEITDLQKSYLSRDLLDVIPVGRGVTWLDTGTPETMSEASDFIRTIEKRRGLKIACLEEIALYMNYIDTGKFREILEEIPPSPYKTYLLGKTGGL